MASFSVALVASATAAREAEQKARWDREVNVPLKAVLDGAAKTCFSCQLAQREAIQHHLGDCPHDTRFRSNHAEFAEFKRAFKLPEGSYCFNCTRSREVTMHLFTSDRMLTYYTSALVRP